MFLSDKINHNKIYDKILIFLNKMIGEMKVKKPMSTKQRE
jgi:hypothetical protein